MSNRFYTDNDRPAGRDLQAIRASAHRQQFKPDMLVVTPGNFSDSRVYRFKGHGESLVQNGAAMARVADANGNEALVPLLPLRRPHFPILALACHYIFDCDRLAP